MNLLVLVKTRQARVQQLTDQLLDLVSFETNLVKQDNVASWFGGALQALLGLNIKIEEVRMRYTRVNDKSGG